MVFTVLAAADIHSTKLNYEFDFPTQPTLAEFQSKVDAVFSMESATRRQPTVPNAAFLIHRMQIFDDRTDKWNDLVSGTQLVDYCQVYIFQKESPWHKEVQSKIPPAVRAPVTPSAAPVTVAAPASAPTPAATLATLAPPVAMAPAPAASAYYPPLPSVIPANPNPPDMGLPSAALHPLPTAAPIPSATAAALAAATPTPAPVTTTINLMPHASPAPAPVVYPVPISVPIVELSECTFDQKMRSTFEALGPIADFEAFAGFLAKIRIDFPEETLRDIFAKSDTDRNQMLSLGEFQRFAEGYPTLLDSMFYRLQDHNTDVQQQESVAAAKRMVATLREKESDARVAAVQAQRETEEQVQRLRNQQAEVMTCEAREADAKAVLEASIQEVERSQADVTTGRHGVVKAKENEQLKQIAFLDSQRAVEISSNKVRTLESDTLRAEERMREIERLLLEQQREVERHRELSLQARTELVTSQTFEQQASEAVRCAETGTKLATETLQQLETALAASQARERDCNQLLIAVREELARNLAGRDHEEYELQQCKDRETVKVCLEGEASRACDAQHEHAQALENENLEHNVRRRQTEEKERPLLDQEVRLRLQRQNLELEEARLRDDHKSFHSTTGRAQTPSVPALGFNIHTAAVAPSLRGIDSHTSPIRGLHSAQMTPIPPSSVTGSPARRGLSPHIRRSSPPTSPRL